jgi:hypothetical protein
LKSLALLPQIEALPCTRTGRLSLEEIAEHAGRMRSDFFGIELAVGTEAILSHLFETRNVPDVLADAHAASFPNVSADMGLHEHYQMMLDRSPDSVGGFISTLKGKVAELRVAEQLEAQNPGWDFTIADNPTHAGWDLIGVSPEGEELLIQVKTGSAEYADSVADAMAASPDTMFAVSSEIHDAIATSHPELLDQIVDVQWTDFELTGDVNEGLSLLADNLGIDVPDAWGEVIPLMSEAFLAYRVYRTVSSVKSQYSAIAVEDRQRIAFVRVFTLVARYGTTSGLMVIGGTTLQFPGAIAGWLASLWVNKQLQPHVLELALRVCQLSHDDLFYFRNKTRIDDIGAGIHRCATSVA